MTEQSLTSEHADTPSFRSADLDTLKIRIPIDPSIGEAISDLPETDLTHRSVDHEIWWYARDAVAHKLVMELAAAYACEDITGEEFVRKARLDGYAKPHGTVSTLLGSSDILADLGVYQPSVSSSHLETRTIGYFDHDYCQRTPKSGNDFMGMTGMSLTFDTLEDPDQVIMERDSSYGLLIVECNQLNPDSFAGKSGLRRVGWGFATARAVWEKTKEKWRDIDKDGLSGPGERVLNSLMSHYGQIIEGESILKPRDD